MNSIKNSLKAARKRTAYGFYFMPNDELKKVLTKESVHQRLLECRIPPESVADTLKLVLANATKTFAILIRCGQESLVLECMENSLFDDKLPLETPIPELQLNDEFYRVQWEFVAPVFTKTSVVLKLKDSHILPFLEDSKMDKVHGGYANAFRVALDPGHQALPDSQTSQDSQTGGSVVLFRKELKSSEDEDPTVVTAFREEDRILKMLNSLHNENIIEIYMSYKHRGTYSFLFPLADGDLSKLLREHSRPVALQTEASFIKALHGLASALAEVHNFDSKTLALQFKGCHHDLKPQNILISGNKFLLADFGLSRFKTLDDDSTSISKNIGEYLAPECRGAEHQRRLIGRKSDIWSFGCIILELLVYMDAGKEGVEQFRSSRMTVVDQWTNRAFHHSGQIKTSVDQLLTKMSSRRPDNSYPLISELIRQMLQPDPGRRPGADVVRRVLCSLEAKTILDDSIRLFSLLTALYQDLGLLLEGERLRAWASTVGVLQHQTIWKWPACQVDLLTKPTLDALQSMYDELQLIERDWSEQEETKNRAISFPGADIDDPNKGCPDGRMLHACNDRLVALLDPISKKAFNRYLFRRMLRTEDAGNLREIESEAEGYSGVADLKPLTQLKLVFQLAREKELMGELQHKVPENAKVKVTGTLEHHSKGKYMPPAEPEEDVLIEWRPMNSPSQAISQELLSRVDALAGLSFNASEAAGIRVLECIGYYLNEERRAFGMLYRYPQLNSQVDSKVLEPLSLYRVILSTANDTHGRPFLGDRFAIARSIASCILYCHTINWLHERLNSFNVVFFLPHGALTATRRTLPFVVGFDHSRQDEKDAFSHGPPADERFQHYLHPEYSRRKRFRKLFDYYSVGLLLLEIGLWRTLESMTSGYIFHDLEGIRKELVERYVPGLRYSMGEIYYLAVRACLDNGLGTTDTSDDDIAERFQVLVVDKLDKCIV